MKRSVLMIRATTAAILTASVSSSFASETQLPDPLQAGWKGVPVCERLRENAQHRILQCTFPPGVGHERHFHSPYFGYAVVGGRFRITDKDGVREVDLPTGSHFENDGVEWHEVLNVGETTSIYLIIETK